MGAHPRRLPTQAGTLCERTRSDTELLKMKENTSAIVIVCALAVCGTMIYFTADGQEEPEAVLVGGLGAPQTVSTMRGPASVASTDVQKAGTIVTNTPDGRMRLTDYLQNVEKEIHSEESSMQGKGVLQVDKVANKAGNWVFVNGRAVGLSSKLNDFETLAVHMGQYEATLAKMTSKMTTKKKKKGPGYVKPPEWRGD